MNKKSRPYQINDGIIIIIQCICIIVKHQLLSPPSFHEKSRRNNFPLHTVSKVVGEYSSDTRQPAHELFMAYTNNNVYVYI